MTTTRYPDAPFKPDLSPVDVTPEVLASAKAMAGTASPIAATAKKMIASLVAEVERLQAENESLAAELHEWDGWVLENEEKQAIVTGNI